MSSQQAAAFAAGLAIIRREHDIPGAFPTTVLVAGEAAAGRAIGDGRVDLTDRRFVTLDPAASTDLDQAFAIERGGDDVIVHYAIADVAWFVRPGDPIDAEAWTRGLTIYLPGERVGLHPPRLAEDAASLLPDQTRPAVVFTVRVAEDGGVHLDAVRRAVVRSHAKLAYETVRPEDLPDGFSEVTERIAAAEERRGASRVEFPEQRIEIDGGLRLVFRAREESAVQNSALSLATNLAVADALMAARTGLFRVMAEPDERAIKRLRITAQAFGLHWPPDQSLGDFQRGLDASDPRAAAFLLAVRRAGGKASYAPYTEGSPPWHAAMAAAYAQATAPLRRLADRYVIEAAYAVANDRAVPDWVEAGIARLPQVMSDADDRAARIDRTVLDLAEAVELSGREGDTFAAVVTDEDDRGARIQITDPAIVARVTAHDVQPGDDITVRLVKADPKTRTTKFERTS